MAGGWGAAGFVSAAQMLGGSYSRREYGQNMTFIHREGTMWLCLGRSEELSSMQQIATTVVQAVRRKLCGNASRPMKFVAGKLDPPFEVRHRADGSPYSGWLSRGR